MTQKFSTTIQDFNGQGFEVLMAKDGDYVRATFFNGNLIQGESVSIGNTDVTK